MSTLIENLCLLTIKLVDQGEHHSAERVIEHSLGLLEYPGFPTVNRPLSVLLLNC